MGTMPVSSPGVGYDRRGATSRMLNGSGGTALVGDVLTINETVIDATTLRWTTVHVPATTEVTNGITGVVVEGGASGAELKVQFNGIVKALIAANLTAGQDLGISNTNKSFNAVASAANAFAKLLVTTAAAPELAYVNLKGEGGWGNLA